MSTCKIAITIPQDLLPLVDQASRARGLSRSGYISAVLRERLTDEQHRWLKDAYDRVFEDHDLRRRQASPAGWEKNPG